MSYVFLDLETTGLDADKNFITEVAAVKTNEYGDVIEEFHSMVRLPEGEKVPEFIVGLTGITDELLEAEGRAAIEVMEELRQFTMDCIVVAQYAPFDLSYIEKFFTVANFYDTRTMAYALDLPSAKLDGIAEHYGIELGEHHRALSDAHTCKSIFFEMVETFANDGLTAGSLMNVVGTKPERMPKVYPVNTLMIIDYGEED